MAYICVYVAGAQTYRAQNYVITFAFVCERLLKCPSQQSALLQHVQIRTVHRCTRQTSGYTRQTSGYTRQTSGYTRQTSGYTRQTSGYTRQTSGCWSDIMKHKYRVRILVPDPKRARSNDRVKHINNLFSVIRTAYVILLSKYVTKTVFEWAFNSLHTDYVCCKDYYLYTKLHEKKPSILRQYLYCHLLQHKFQ